MEPNLTRQPRLNQPIRVDQVAIQLEARVVQHCPNPRPNFVSAREKKKEKGRGGEGKRPTKVDATAASLPLGEVGRRDEVPELGEVVPEDVLLGRGEVVAAGGLELLDVVLGHLEASREKLGSLVVEEREK